MNAAHTTFHDLRPASHDLAAAALAGLSAAQKSIPPKFFYDAAGSQLFEAICAQPEYYLPDAEREIFAVAAADMARALGDDLVLIEPGAGSATKVRWLLEHLRPRAYVPIDISHEHLAAAVTDLTATYPWLHVHAAVADFTHSLPIPADVPAGRRAAFFPGSSLGNFEPADAVTFLRLLRQTIGPDGQVLIGVDRKKDRTLLDAAYNDAAGVTARFNLNLLQRLNREVGADFDLAGFVHHAFYNEDRGRIEMHLVSRHAQVVQINGTRVQFRSGETIHTENSYKYSTDDFIALAARAGLVCPQAWSDARAYFGVYLLAAD